MTLSDDDGESDTESLPLHEAEWAQREAFDKVFRYSEVEEKLDNQYDAEVAGYPLDPMEAALKALQRRQDVKRAHDAANGDTIPAKRAKGELESSSGRPDASVPNDMPHTA